MNGCLLTLTKSQILAFYAKNTDAFQVDFTSAERGNTASSSD